MGVDVATRKKTKERIVPDTSVIISGTVSKALEKRKVSEIIIPSFVVEELQAQANRGLSIGLKGLEEIKRLREIAKKHGIKFAIKGRLQTLEEIKLAKSGRIDTLIIEVAKKNKASLYTADLVQALVAEVQGVKTVYFQPYERKRLKIEDMLTEDTLSLHLKENAYPYAKRGKPGAFKLVKLRDEPLTSEEMEGIIQEILEAVRYETHAFVEITGKEATVVQLGNMRIAITKPPFSDGTEVTIVRPIVKLTLDDYKLRKELKERIMKGEGIIIAGPPGSGKSTLAASIAEFYLSLGKVVKTIEQPRDLQVCEEITQYAKLHGDVEKTAEMLLLVRPDYTIFDEVRTTKDFLTFIDMRLAGIGMVGVIHATSAIDAIQRFVKRVELGMLPHVIDTVLFVEGGEIKKVYKLSLQVRVPTGMKSEDLVRPLVEVRDFFSGELEYEIYTFGEENVIVNVREVSAEESAVERLAAQRILKEIRRFDKHAEVKFTRDTATVYVSNEAVPRIIGKKGKTISELEKKLGIHIDVVPKARALGREVEFSFRESGGNLVFTFDKSLVGKKVDFYIDNEYVATLVVGKKGEVKLNRRSEVAQRILSALLKQKLSVFAER